MLSFTILNWKTKFLRCYHKSWHYNYYFTSIKFLSLYISRVVYCWPFTIDWYEVLFFDRMFACFQQWMSNMLCVIFINKEYIKYYAHFCFDPVSWMREISTSSALLRSAQRSSVKNLTQICFAQKSLSAGIGSEKVSF